jgi:hypothetical protein
MRRVTIPAVACLLLAVALLGVYAIAADPMPMGAGAMAGATSRPGMMGACPICGMMSGQPSAEMKEMMTKAGVTEQMVMQCRGMMNAPMHMDSPAVLMGMDEGLMLTEEQKAKLMDIDKDARAKALAVLTADQKAKLGMIPEKPMSVREGMMEMHKKMMPVMMEKMKAQGKEMPMCCPMMMQTMQPAKEGMKAPGMTGGEGAMPK